jgi:hypothetical protein
MTFEFILLGPIFFNLIISGQVRLTDQDQVFNYEIKNYLNDETFLSLSKMSLENLSRSVRLCLLPPDEHRFVGGGAHQRRQRQSRVRNAAQQITLGHD